VNEGGGRIYVKDGGEGLWLKDDGRWIKVYTTTESSGEKKFPLKLSF
jgi:hypothetical protein